jgi:hypothetical protein
MSLGLMLMGLSYGVGLILTAHGALYGGARYVVAGICGMGFAFLLLLSA